MDLEYEAEDFFRLPLDRPVVLRFSGIAIQVNKVGFYEMNINETIDVLLHRESIIGGWCGIGEFASPYNSSEARIKFIETCQVVGVHYDLTEKALYLFDRFMKEDDLSWMLNSGACYLALGCSLWSVSKTFEEVPMKLRDLTLTGVAKELIISLEQEILASANWNLNKPTCRQFYTEFRSLLDLNMEADQADIEVYIAKIAFERATMEPKFAFAQPSALALAVLFHAINIGLALDETSAQCPYNALRNSLHLPTRENYEYMKYHTWYLIEEALR